MYSTLKQTPFKRKPPKAGQYSSLRPRSDKEMERMKRYKELKEQYLASHRYCQFPGCHSKAKDIHHKARRNGENLFRHFMAVCRTHHNYIEANTRWAREEGYLMDVSGRD